MCPNTRVRFRHTANNLVSRKKVKWLEKTYNLARFGGPKIANRKSNYNCTVHFDVRRIVVVTNTSRWTFRRKQTDRWGLLGLLMLGDVVDVAVCFDVDVCVIVDRDPHFVDGK